MPHHPLQRVKTSTNVNKNEENKSIINKSKGPILNSSNEPKVMNYDSSKEIDMSKIISIY